MKNFVFAVAMIVASLAQPAVSRADDQAIFAQVEKAVEDMGFSVQEKRFYNDMAACRKNLDGQIGAARRANPNVEVIDLKPYMKLEGHYSFAVATSETDFYGHYCLPSPDGRAGYFKAKKI